METKQAVLPLSAPVSTSILLCFGNRHNHITVCDETIFVSSMTLYQQAGRSYIQTPFLRCKMLVGGVPQTPLFCIFQCRLRIPAGRFYPVMLSGSSRTCIRCDAASARDAYFICSDTCVFRSEMSHSCIHFASSLCASSAASRRTSGEVSVSRT